MTTKVVARCGIYDKRPEVCKVYPKVDHYIPPECTYMFSGANRQGTCTCDEGACCNVPRQDGEPGGVPLPDVAGGQPCKYLVWVDQEEEPVKTAEDTPKIADDTRMATERLLNVIESD